MKIALIGYGKMGKTIEEIAIQRGHEIVLKIGSQNREEMTDEHIRRAEVCIEFSTPESAFDNIARCLQAGVPTISGSTAWLSQLAEAQALCLEQGTAFLYASNFSLGVNLFFAINDYVASLMHQYPLYTVRMEEIHHTAKKDAPSGTAVTLAEKILQHYTEKEKWVNHDSAAANELSILSKRIDPAPGTHSILYESAVDTIEIKHTAHSRQGFALGAVIAAEFIADRKGIFTMSDVLR